MRNIPDEPAGKLVPVVPWFLSPVPDVPLMDIPNGIVPAVFTAPRTTVVVRHITERVDGIRKNFLVEVTTIEKRERCKS